MIYVLFRRQIAFFTCFFLLTQCLPLGVFADSVIFGSTGSLPRGILLDSSGSLYTANSNGNTLSKITPDGTSTVFATTGLTPYALVSDGSGNLYTVNNGDNTISKITPDGTSTVFATTGSSPYAIVSDGSGNLYVANRGDNTISKITPDGTSTVFATTGSSPNSIIRDSAGNLYTANFGDNTISKITPDGTSTVFATTGVNPYDLTIDPLGNIFTVNFGENTISKITPDGTSTFLGNTGYMPVSIVLDGSGNIYTLNNGNSTVSKISSTGSSYIYGSTGYSPFDMAIDGSGVLYVANYQENTVTKITPDTTPPYMFLYGGNEVTSYQGYGYSEQGVYCSDAMDGYITSVNSGSVDTNTLGDYTLNYSCTDRSGNTVAQNRIVHVVIDTEAPVISLSGNPEMNVYLGTSYSEAGAYCMDNAFGWCGYISVASSGSVDTNNTGTYILTYSYTDLAGNTGSTIRTVHVLQDTEPPVISLYGNSMITISVGSTYNESGAYCIDNADGWCGYVGVSSGSVDTNNTGTYMLTYSFVDRAGNTGSTLRTVNIGPDTTPPVITLSGDNPVNLIGPQYYYDWNYPVSATDDDPTFNGVVSHTPAGSYIYMTEGNHTITYTATDPSGNTATAVRVVHVTDSTPPYANLYTNQTIDTTPYLYGYINDPTASIDITLEGHTYSGVNTGTGNWFLPDNTISPELTTGTHALDLRAVDPSGNISTYNYILTILPKTDLSLHMRLVNTGTISSGALVTYEFNIKNEMNVDYTSSSLVEIVGLLPNSINMGEPYNISNTFIETSDPSIRCQNYGPTEAFGTLFTNYPAHGVLLCLPTSRIAIPAGQSISFRLSFPVTHDFPEGLTVHALVIDVASTDLDGNEIQTAVNQGHDIFALINNNISHSIYTIPHPAPPVIDNPPVVSTGSIPPIGPSGSMSTPIQNSLGNNSVSSAQMELLHTLPIFPKVNPPKNLVPDTLVPSIDLNSAFERVVDSLKVSQIGAKKEIEHPLTDTICTKLVQIHTIGDIQAKDLPENEFRGYIQKLISYGIDTPENTGSIQGIVNNTDSFRGDENITRGEYVKMLFHALSCNEDITSDTKHTFSDVSETDEFLPFIRYAMSHKWISGYSDGTFRPNYPLSRAEAMKILSRAIDLDTSKNTIPPSGRTLFDDVGKDNEFAPYVYALMAHGVIQGKSIKNFSPDESVTRQEMAKIFSKVFLGE